MEPLEERYSLSMRSPRLLAALSILVIIPVGFYTKVYSGPGHDWVNGSLGGVFYEILWCVAAYFAVPRWRPGAISVVVLAATCGIEFLQLWHPPLLQAARGTFVGRTILGDTFVWADFPPYFLGSAAGYLWLKALPQAGRAT
jgi:hypothetical protein